MASQRRDPQRRTTQGSQGKQPGLGRPRESRTAKPPSPGHGMRDGPKMGELPTPPPGPNRLVDLEGGTEPPRPGTDVSLTRDHVGHAVDRGTAPGEAQGEQVLPQRNAPAPAPALGPGLGTGGPTNPGSHPAAGDGGRPTAEASPRPRTPGGPADVPSALMGVRDAGRDLAAGSVHPPTAGDSPRPEDDLPGTRPLGEGARRHRSLEAPAARGEEAATRAMPPEEQVDDAPQMRNFRAELARRNALYTTISTPGDKRPQQEHRITDAVLRVVRQGEAGDRLHLALTPPTGWKPGTLKGATPPMSNGSRRRVC